MLQQQLANTTGLDPDATIFEICAALDEQGLDIQAVLDGLEVTLVPIVEEQISKLVLTIVAAINDLLGTSIVLTPEEVIDAVDIDAIVAQITANVEVSLGILAECLDLPPTPPPTTETLTVIKTTECQADAQTCQQNPIQPSNFTVVINDNNPSQNNFPGSSTGTDVELEPGAYNVTEQGLDPVTPVICSPMDFDSGSTLGDDLFICTNFSEECEGDITIGNPQTCTIENILVQQDDEMDLAVVNRADDDVSILLGNGDGTFGPKTDFPVGSFPRSVAVGLFNADSNLDLVVVNQPDDDVSILLGNGDGTFGPKTDFPVGIQPIFVAVGLFNADSNLDLVVVNLADDDVSILLGNGDGTFGPKTDFPVGINHSLLLSVSSTLIQTLIWP